MMSSDDQAIMGIYSTCHHYHNPSSHTQSRGPRSEATMVTTRSKAGKQTDLEDFAASAKPQPTKKTSPATKSKLQNNIPNPPASSEKRKASEVKPKRNGLKKSKTTASSLNNEITINRAPVLTLWSASVTQFLHPSLEWSTCLSAGKAISAICAVSKGRSIGTISEPDVDDSKKKDKKNKQIEVDELEVMHFKLEIKDGVVFFGGKAQNGSEDGLKGKFGDQYDDVRGAFDEGLQKWGERKEELDKLAFGMYESFRPEVPMGLMGWGRKGILDLEKIREVIGGRA
jgi:hypothetical protein